MPLESITPSQRRKRNRYRTLYTSTANSKTIQTIVKKGKMCVRACCCNMCRHGIMYTRKSDVNVQALQGQDVVKGVADC